MIVVCPSCSAKYKLADSKIKAKGTKVRCPKCTHTFFVYPEESEPEVDERTEFIQRPSELSKTLEPKKKQEEEQKKTSEEDHVFDEKTMLSSDEQAALPSTPSTQEESEDSDTIFENAFNKESSQEKADEDEHTIEEKRTESEPQLKQEQEPEQQKVKAFGDATLFEIQRAAKKKKPKKSVIISAAIALGVAGIAILGYLLLPSLTNLSLKKSKDSSTETQATSHEIPRPSGWYRHDPQVYQQSLAQIAALPKAERKRPETQALLAETLIANGLLMETADQVTQGLSYLPNLALNYPDSAMGLYGTAAFAFWSEEPSSVQNLLKRWPEHQKDEPEFRLLQVMDLNQSDRIKEALKAGTALLKDKPNFQRATNYMTRMFLKHPKLADKIVAGEIQKKTQNLYERHRRLLEDQVEKLPPLHQEIERLLGNKNKKTKEKAPPKEKKATPTEEPKKVKVKTPAPNPIEGRQRRKASKTLPEPSKNLVAANAKVAEAKSEAQKFLQKGNDQFENGELEAAMQSYREALQQDESLAEVWRQKGRIHMNKDESQRALRSFKMYLLLSPQADDRNQVQNWIDSLQ